MAEPRTIEELVAALKAERPDWNPDFVALTAAAEICEAGVTAAREKERARAEDLVRTLLEHAGHTDCPLCTGLRMGLGPDERPRRTKEQVRELFRQRGEELKRLLR